jgi:hypothetical protein
MSNFTRTPTLLMMICLLFSLSFPGCLDSNNDRTTDQTPGTGLLRFVGIQAGAGSREINKTCTGVDLRFLIKTMKVSSGVISEGMSDGLNWTTIYEGNAPRKISEMNFSATLPVGNYNNIRFEWRNWFQWVFTYNDTEVAKNESNFANGSAFYDPSSEQEFFYPTINNENGSWKYNGSSIWLMNAREKMGGFEIRQGQTTTIAWRFNVNSLVWGDANDNGIMDPGDSIGNYSGPPNATPSGNMMDFIVSYG